MTYHQSSAVSVASVLTAATVIVLGYRAGRTHAAWRDVRSAKRSVLVNRRYAWSHTIRMVVSGLAILAAIATITYVAARSHS
jgi:hypothetical protein